MKGELRVPCAYQGGKQRVAEELVDILLQGNHGANTRFYDLCCGSGAISIELVNRGIDPSHIVMLDCSSWGVFWSAIGSGSFNMKVFDGILAEVPEDKHEVKSFMSGLAKRSMPDYEAELYPVLQSCSFGGKQIWFDGKSWRNAFFRDYWEPTETSVRRSPANPMQPSASELRRRVHGLVGGMRGVNCVVEDISVALERDFPDDAVVYVDPPYRGTTGYAFGFDLASFISVFCKRSQASLFVSEGLPLNESAVLLQAKGARGGITGMRKGQHQEWLNRFQ